ncbi:hypothetical protein PSTG_02345 [Puccinia striiformis f. sp. tritici PST-78]|uniref:Uncharacterized protein n=1 Tax=Puccinia striiformis f. sp. tritici PST-78 TaxID=1165861 RepID=A0A0L0VZJ7_9BASI|nr:hypothetical protein PSTG_02345 [Puccinia striiformis f. sp. tritici PST-78]
MSTHQSNLRNKKKLSGVMLGIGFRGGYEKGNSAGNDKPPLLIPTVLNLS